MNISLVPEQAAEKLGGVSSEVAPVLRDRRIGFSARAQTADPSLCSG